MTGVTVIKLFGERNTGTNYVSELLSRNFAVPQLRGTAEDDFLARQIRRAARVVGQNKLADEMWEKHADRYFQHRYTETLGWKHSRIDVDQLINAAPENLGVLMLIKNPYSWLLSLFKRPYHGAKATGSLSDFVQSDYTIRGRDNMLVETCKPIEIWNEKVRSYFALVDAMQTAKVVQYENLLTDEKSVVADLAAGWTMNASGSHKGVEQATKGDQKTQDDYRAYYLQEKWRAKLDQRSLDLINSQIDRDVLKRCGYALLTDL